MRTFLCFVVFGLLAELDFQGYIDLHILWIFFLSAGTYLAIIRDIVEIQAFVETKNQLKEVSNQIKKL